MKQPMKLLPSRKRAMSRKRTGVTCLDSRKKAARLGDRLGSRSSNRVPSQIRATHPCSLLGRWRGWDDVSIALR
jgi:hypothetical protein